MARSSSARPVTGDRRRGRRRVEVRTPSGERRAANAVISSLPLRTLAAIAEPQPAGRVLEAAAGLRYRDFICVALVLDGDDPVPRQLDLRPRSGGPRRPDPELPRLEPRPRTRAGPHLPRARVLLLRGRRALGRRPTTRWSPRASARARPRSGSARAEAVVAGHVVRVPKAYPIYDAGYEDRVATLRALARRARRPRPDRPQRPSPLQQLRPLDADRDARGREPLRRRAATTSGR